MVYEQAAKREGVVQVLTLLYYVQCFCGTYRLHLTQVRRRKMDDCIIQYLAQDLNERFQCTLLAHKPLRWHFTITFPEF